MKKYEGLFKRVGVKAPPPNYPSRGVKWMVGQALVFDPTIKRIVIVKI